jgi:hypothetical protein
MVEVKVAYEFDVICEDCGAALYAYLDSNDRLVVSACRCKEDQINALENILEETTAELNNLRENSLILSYEEPNE